jgi:hypothetical protein
MGWVCHSSFNCLKHENRKSTYFNEQIASQDVFLTNHSNADLPPKPNQFAIAGIAA